MITHLVRHGESVWNREQRIQGQSPDAPGLTEQGVRQAADTASALSRLGAELVVSSDLARARETAAVIAEQLGLPVLIDPRLRERQLGIAEGRPLAEFPEPALGVRDGVVVDPERAPEGAESIRQLRNRVAALLTDLARAARPEAVVLVTHGGVVRAARSLVAGEPLESMTWTSVGNASVLTAALDAFALTPGGSGVPIP